ncbi:MAG: hypothetical protein R2824_09755 [Saprospiraceae bacterium]
MRRTKGNTGVKRTITEKRAGSTKHHNQSKPIKIKDVHHKRILAMRSLNHRLFKHIGFFKSLGLNKYKALARSLDFDLWFHAREESIKDYLEKNLGKATLAKVDPDFKEKLVYLLREVIVDRNRIYKATSIDYQEINIALIRGNLTQDFLFSYIDDQLTEDLATEFKVPVGLLFKAISIIQYSLILEEQRSPNYLSHLLESPKPQVVIDQLVDHFKSSNFKASVLKLVHKKLKKESVRSSFAAWTFKHLSHQTTSRVDPKLDIFMREDFPFLIEIAMCIMYYDNQIIDIKGKVNRLSEIKKNLVARSMLKDWCFEYMEAKLERTEHRQMVTKALRKIFSSVDVGQHLDKSWNTFATYDDDHFFYNGLSKKLFKNLWQNVEHPAWDFMRDWIMNMRQWMDYSIFQEAFNDIRKENRTKSHYLNLYLDRIFLTNSALFKSIVELSSEITGYRGEEKDKLSIMATGYGMALQIVNDHADFISIPWYSNRKNGTVEKGTSDIYNDILNKTMSLPLIIHAGRNDKESMVHRLIRLKRSKLNRIQRFKLQKELFLSKTLQTSVEASQRMVRIFNKKYKLRKNTEASLFLRDLPSICFYNKYNTERSIIEQQFMLLEEFKDLALEVQYQFLLEIDALRSGLRNKFLKTYRQINLLSDRVYNYCIQGLLAIRNWSSALVSKNVSGWRNIIGELLQFRNYIKEFLKKAPNARPGLNINGNGNIKTVSYREHGTTFIELYLFLKLLVL